MNGIQVKNLVKTYITQSTDIILNGAKRPSTTRTVLHGVSVDFPAGKLTAILGRSGCGKSTLLRLIDGTKDAPDSGEIVMPEGWRCALLSPDPYVITWTSVERNVAMAAGAGRTPEERLELAKKLVKLVRLEDYADMTPVELSTGMRQRLGLARVLASQAQVLLMDEPFASLDFITRGELQAELLDIQKELQKTMLENTLAMQQKNKDTIGWLYIDGTTVNDVVVKVNYNDDNKYYLRRNANGENDNDGCYYADFRCTSGNRSTISKNTVIYNLGRAENALLTDYQNHANGPKFAQLLKYQDEDFAKTHPYIYYSTIEEDMVWQVFAVFYTDIKFDYINPNPADATFNSLIKKAQDLSFYDYDVEVTSNDKILTLSTCTYRLADDTKLHYPNDYRYVVMAKLLPADAVLEDTVSLTVTKNAPVKPAGE